jgi:hypothetical protein
MYRPIFLPLLAATALLFAFGTPMTVRAQEQDTTTDPPAAPAPAPQEPAQAQPAPQPRQGGGRGFGGAPFGFFGGGNTSAAMSDPTRSAAMNLVQRPDVQQHLQLSFKQKQALADLQSNARQEFMQKMRENFQNLRNLTPQQRREQSQQLGQQMREAVTNFTGELDKKAEAILTPAQQKRLRELDLQWRGPLALGDPKLAEEMQLTPQQRSSVNTTVQEFRQTQMKAMQQLFAAFRPNRGAPGPDGGAANAPQPPQPPNPEEIQNRRIAVEKDVAKARKAASDKALSLLTPEQAQHWQALQGKPFLFRNLDM